jgi:3-methyladenine DNA glycosylase AlkD
MIVLQNIKNDLKDHSNEGKAGYLPKFFQSFPGGYGEGDTFLGVSIPHQRAIAKKYATIVSHGETELLLRSGIHEYRMTAVFILVFKFEKSVTEKERDAVVRLYLDNLDFINNWDLVDSSAYKLLGPWLMDRDKSLLYNLAASENLWKQRIAIITTLHFIRNGHYEDTLKLATILLDHDHDLIHKAVGWMLREIGNRDQKVEMEFLRKHYSRMPRTMLRYAIEKFDPGLRQAFLKGTILAD